VGKQSRSRLAEATAERHGIDRRTLIKGAAVVGAVGWTAPIIVESLTSPAAAISGQTGCHAIRFNGSKCSPDCNNAPKACFTELCQCKNGQDPIIACFSFSASTCDGTVAPFSISISTTLCANCTFTQAAAHSNADVCTNATFSNGNKTATFQAPATGTSYDQIQVEINCT
jgi:hypothetical protein